MGEIKETSTWSDVRFSRDAGTVLLMVCFMQAIPPLASPPPPTPPHSKVFAVLEGEKTLRRAKIAFIG